MLKTDLIRLRHMLDAAREATSFARNKTRLIHVYFDIDLDRVWDTVTDDLPPLIATLEKTISQESEL